MDFRHVTAALAAPLVATLSCSAGLDLGARAERNQVGRGAPTIDTDFGSAFGTYVAQVTDASASLGWFASNCTFTGFASGGEGVIAKSQGIALYDFSEAMSFSITYGLASALGDGNTVGWTVVDLASSDFVFGLNFEGAAATTVGGVGSSANGSFSGTLQAGSYLLVAAADCAAAGGSFSYSAAFAPVPAPGAVALLGALGLLGSRRRR